MSCRGGVEMVLLISQSPFLTETRKLHLKYFLRLNVFSIKIILDLQLINFIISLWQF